MHQSSLGETSLRVPVERVFFAKFIILTCLTILVFTLVYFHESARKKHERELELQVEKVNNALNIRALFIANMSHEFRTPLNGIMGVSELLELETDNENVHHRVDTIKSSAGILLKLVNDILQYSKLESGDQDIVTTSFSPGKK